jgi:hypothetical protein
MPVFASNNSFAGVENKVANQSSSANTHEPFFKAMAKGNDIVIQRDTDPKADAAVKKPDLSSVSAKDPASSKSHPGLINSALLASKYANYFSGKLKDAGAIDAKDKFVVESSQQNFVNEYNKCYGTNVTTLSGTNGFYCPSNHTIHLVPNAEFGMAFHESVHKASALASAITNAAWTHEPNFAFDLDEGLTSYYSKDILESDYKINNYTDGYSSQRKKAAALIKTYGEDEVAKFYFQYNVQALLSKLGITSVRGDMNVILVSKLKAAFYV